MLTIERFFYQPHRDHGYWSPSTSSSNFCEEDYQTSHYIGEFINTISNLAYIYYALRAPKIPIHPPNRPNGNSTIRVPRDKTIWDLHTPALMAVGITSGMFHMTLQPLPQWFDESSMYILAASFIHSLLTTTYIRAPKKGAANGKAGPNTLVLRQNQKAVALCLVGVLSTTSYISYATGNLTIHTITFGLLLITSGVKLINLLFTFETPAQIAAARNKSFLGMKVTPTQKIMLTSLLRSYLLLNLAFGLWLVDCDPGACAWLRYIRNDVLGAYWFLSPLGYLTELHGWWHIFTARAAGEYISLVRVLTTAG